MLNSLYLLKSDSILLRTNFFLANISLKNDVDHFHKEAKIFQLYHLIKHGLTVNIKNCIQILL